MLPASLAAREFPRIRTPDLRQTNLPSQLDSFVGREGPLEEIVQHLVQGETRLLTVLATGGTGKTRLAQRFAGEHLADFPGGAWFCDLENASSEEGILIALGNALNVPLTEQDRLQQIGRAIRGRGRVLLLLDNFEQVVDHAASTVGTWLQLAPEARFLVTSRRRLSLGGEQLIYLNPLSTSEGIQLFQDRGRMVKPDFQLDDDVADTAAEIVERLDGLSLAIELAAARLHMLSPRQILDRLDDRFRLLRSTRSDITSRQGTLSGVLDWSWDLLKPEEKLALAQVSVFHGSFAIEAAEEVLNLDHWPDVPWTMDVLQSLADHSLVRLVETGDGQRRFSMFESIRAYAAARITTPEGVLAASGEPLTTAAEHQKLLARHARHYARLGAPESLRALEGKEATNHLLKMGLEKENLLAGVEHGLETRDFSAASGCVLALQPFFELEGPYDKGADLAGRVLAQEGLQPEQRVRLMSCRGSLLCLQGAKQEGEALLQQGLELAQQEGLVPLATRLHLELGELLITLGKNDLAETHLDAGRAGAEGEPALKARVHDAMGRLHTLQSRLESAQEEFESALGLYRASHNRRREGIVLGRLGGLLGAQGKPEVALEYLEAALAMHKETGNRRFEASVLMDIGHLARVLGMEQEAVTHFEQALRLARYLGAGMIEGAVRGNLGDLLLDQGNLEMAEHHLCGAIEICSSAWPEAAAAFQGSLALIRVDQDNPTEAKSLLEQAEGCLRGLESPELGKVLCKKGVIDLRLGDRGAAQGALEEATALAESHGMGAESDLALWLNTLRDALAET